MADLKTLVNELPKLVYNLKLTIGDSHEMMQQIIQINHAQKQLRNIQEAIAQEISFDKPKSAAINTLPRLSTSSSIFIPSIFLVDTAISGRTRLIIEKFGNPQTEISLIDLKSKIACWIEWGDLLQAIAADILVDSHLVTQLNLDINQPSLPNQLQHIDESLKINLDSKSEILQQQIQQIINIQEDLLQIQQRLNHIIDIIKNSYNFLTILLGVSSFCGKSGFSLQWLDNDNELIISSDSKFQELTDILNDCELFQNQIFILNEKCYVLMAQAEELLINLNNNRHKKLDIDHSVPTKKLLTPKVIDLSLVIASSLVVLMFGGWIIKDKFYPTEQANLSLSQEAMGVANFKSAQTLGLEASLLVQSPPHPLIVWQQAQAKWQEAIKLLESIPPGTSVTIRAKNKLIRYRMNDTAIRKKVLSEKKALTNLDAAQKLAVEASFLVQSSPHSSLVRQQSKEKLQQAIKLLQAIPSSTFVSRQAKEMLTSYEMNYAATNAIFKN